MSRSLNIISRFLVIVLTAVLVPVVIGCNTSSGKKLGVGDTVGGGGIGDTIGGDEHTGEPVKGDYAVSGTWDLSAPLSSERTLGDVFTDAIVIELDARIPSGTAVEKIDAAIRPSIKAEVDARAPEALRPDSPTMTALAGALASVEVVSELHLEDGGLLDDVSGHETFLVLSVEHEGERFQVTPDAYLSSANAELASDWEAKANTDGETIEVDRHPVAVEYGELVRWVLTDVLEVDEAPLIAGVLDAIACPALVDAMLDGEDGLYVEVAGDEHGFDAEDLQATCDAAMGKLEDRALGLFTKDAKVEVGGTVKFTDADGDGIAETLTSGDDFGGIINVAPEFIAPRVSVAFTATRME